MMRTRLIALFALCLTVSTARAATAPADCILAGPEGADASVEYGGKTYHLRDAACKEEFLSDPERFSQLYDTLLELKQAGKPVPKPPAPASAVPA
jgi:YHS domain-containing protein